jgi:preprotein translocase subunit YajC
VTFVSTSPDNIKPGDEVLIGSETGTVQYLRPFGAVEVLFADGTFYAVARRDVARVIR